MPGSPLVRPTENQPSTSGDPMVALPASVRLETGRGGLPVLLVNGPASLAEIYLHGATVTDWTPRDH